MHIEYRNINDITITKHGSVPLRVVNGVCANADARAIACEEALRRARAAHEVVLADLPAYKRKRYEWIFNEIREHFGQPFRGRPAMVPYAPR